MANEHRSSDDLAFWAFLLSMIGVGAWIAFVFVFIL